MRHSIALALALALAVWISTPARGHALPPLRDVEEAALAHAGLDNTPDWSRRARLAALLPSHVQLEYRHADENDWQRVERIDSLWEGDIELPDDRERRAVIDDDLEQSWRGSVRWDLTALLWTRDELAIADSERELVEARRELTDEVITLYFAILEAELALSEAASDAEARAISLTRDEAWARLDALSDGLLSREATMREAEP